MPEWEIALFNPPKELTPQPMTTVVGIKCIDGIVLAADSQFTSIDVKEEGEKIFKINNHTALTGAGEIGQTRMLVEKIKKELGQEKLSDLDTRQKLESVVLSFYKIYTVEWSRRLELPGYVSFFKAWSIVGTELKDKTFGLYILRFSPDPFVDLITNYEAIGSGDTLAKLVLRQQGRPLAFHKKNFADASISFNAWIAALTINEIKAFEPRSGGATRVAILDKHRFHILTPGELSNHYDGFIREMTRLFPRVPPGYIRALFPKL